MLRWFVRLFGYEIVTRQNLHAQDALQNENALLSQQLVLAKSLVKEATQRANEATRNSALWSLESSFVKNRLVDQTTLQQNLLKLAKAEGRVYPDNTTIPEAYKPWLDEDCVRETMQ